MVISNSFLLVMLSWLLFMRDLSHVKVFLVFSRPYLVRSHYWYAVASVVVCRHRL